MRTLYDLARRYEPPPIGKARITKWRPSPGSPLLGKWLAEVEGNAVFADDQPSALRHAEELLRARRARHERFARHACPDITPVPKETTGA